MSERAAEIGDAPLVRILAALRDAWVGLAIGLIAIGALFHVEIATAIKTWIDSTAYNHCMLVIPIAGYLIWDRRSSLRGLTAAPVPLAALLAVPLAAGWLAAERLGIMEGRQLVALSLIEVLFLTMLGWRLWRAILGPLLYLYFLVPFGEFLTPKLQDVTAWFIRHGVVILGIPAYIDGFIIEIPEGTFFVAEACAGLRFLIASIAFGVLYALLMYRGWTRRALFIAASIVIPIIANGFRALGIVWLGHVLGSAEAGAADHILYGWIFFSIVILLLTVFGLPFRQDDQAELATASPMTPAQGASRRGLWAGLAVAAAACLGPAVVLGLNVSAVVPAVALGPLDLSPTCVAASPPTAPADGAPGQAIVQRVTCGGTPMNVRIAVFSPRSTAAPINAERRRLTRLPEADDTTETPLSDEGGDATRGWRLVRANQPAFIAAAAMWIDGEPTLPGMTMRLRMARTSLVGTAYAPVLVTITPVVDWGNVDMRRKRNLEAQIAALVREHPEIGDRVRTFARAAVR
ncbi:MAG: exosortase [Acetobacteraceae bacterium]|nr:exosortase [Acetobacteraceae bacterium]